jgi:hypothetical protein
MLKSITETFWNQPVLGCYERIKCLAQGNLTMACPWSESKWLAILKLLKSDALSTQPRHHLIMTLELGLSQKNSCSSQNEQLCNLSLQQIHVKLTFPP